jgi:hypothetical protein
MGKIEDGLQDALSYAIVESKIIEWIRDDLPLSAQMILQPKHVRSLVDRICKLRTSGE